MKCWLADFHESECEMRADGRYDRAHLIPQQRIKIALKSRGKSAEEIRAAVWDERLIKPACRAHHHLFDNKTIRLSRDDYTPALHKWAEDNGFYFHSARSGWLPYFQPPDKEAA